MKKAQREIYLELADLVNTGLAQWCKYSDWSSNGSICDGGESWMEGCNHKLPAIRNKFEYDDEGCDMPGVDCWGFQPKHPLSVLAEQVGIILSEEFVGWIFWEEDGQSYYYGVKREGGLNEQV